MFPEVDNGLTRGRFGLGWRCFPAFQISANIDRSVVWNEDAVNRAIRRQAGPCRTSSSRFRRDSPFMAFEELQPFSTSEASGRRPPEVAAQAPGYPRFVATKVIAKSAEVRLQIAGAHSGDLARGRFSPYMRPAPLRAKETRLLYGCTLVNRITPRLAVEVLTGPSGAQA
jgi:hypothetical protein